MTKPTPNSNKYLLLEIQLDYKSVPPLLIPNLLPDISQVNLRKTLLLEGP